MTEEEDLLPEPRVVPPKPKRHGTPGSFTKNDPRAWKGGRPGNFGAWRKMAIDMGNQLAYDARGKAVVDPQGVHLTYAQVILYQWLTVGKYTQQFAETAFGKVPLAIEISDAGPTVITVDLIDDVLDEDVENE